MPITKEEFIEKVGREPTEDELSRVNCEIVGVPGHDHCGWCEEHDKPRIVCKCIAGDNIYMHSKCCGAHWELVKHNNIIGLYCAKCFKSIGDEFKVIIVPKKPKVPQAPSQHAAPPKDIKVDEPPQDKSIPEKESQDEADS